MNDSDSLTSGEYMSAALRQYAAAHGADRPESQWVLSPFDTWELNPHYDGPNQPHPEEWHPEDAPDASAAAEAITDDDCWAHGSSDCDLCF